MQKKGVEKRLVAIAALLILLVVPLKAINLMMVKDTVLASGVTEVEIQVWGSAADTATSGYAISLCYDPTEVTCDSVSELNTVWDAASPYHVPPFDFDPFIYLGTPDNDSGFVTIGCVYTMTCATISAFADTVPLAS